MKLTRLAVMRPVLSIVLSLLVLVLGLTALSRLPVREYPNVDDPTITVTVVYPGASADVVEREITETVEEAVSTIDGIRQVRSTSSDGRSRVEVEFVLDRDLDLAAADVRDSLSAFRNELPDEAEEPVIAQRAVEAQVNMWIVLSSERLDPLQLSDFANRSLVDELTTVPGVATVLLGGERRYAMRVWLELERMKARGVTVLEVERALRAQNVELPAGRLVSAQRELTVRAMTELERPGEFARLVIREEGGSQITLGDVARIRYGPENQRTAARLDGEQAIGLGVVRQTGSNLVAVAGAVRQRLAEIEPRVPDDIDITIAYDESLFVEASIRQIVYTLFATTALVVTVVFFSLASWRSVLVPALTIPSSLVAAFAVLYLLGFSLNVLTLLALILAIGMLVDDAIVVAENVFRNSEDGRPKLVAADRGADEVAFAVIATTVVLLAVIAPLAFLTGDAGRLFTEFAAALGGALAFSSVVALTLGVTVASKLIDAPKIGQGRLYRFISGSFERLANRYLAVLRPVLAHGWLAIAAVALLGMLTIWIYRALPGELAPVEDRGVIIVSMEGPQGATLEYMLDIVRDVEQILLPLVSADGPGEHVISLVAPRGGGQGPVNSAITILRLKDWSEREQSQFEVRDGLLPQLAGIRGALVFAINPPSLASGGFQQPVQMVISADTVGEAAGYANTMLARANALPGIAQARLDYQPTSPQLRISVDRPRAAELGITMREIGRTLQLLLGGDDVSDFSIAAERYEVMLRARQEDRVGPEDLDRIYMRSGSGELVPLSTLVSHSSVGRPPELFRLDRMPSVTLQASLAGRTAIGDVLDKLESAARTELPETARIGYLGASQDYQRSAQAFFFAFGLALLIVYLVLAAQFESFVQPVVLIAGVPLAVLGSLLALTLAGKSLNIFSQIGLILAIGIMAKNAILLVEFANQLRDRGMEFRDALEEAARTRFRPIVMTSIATLFGAVPLALAFGPGAEVRSTVGIVILGGVAIATLMALFLVPPLYLALARNTRPRGALARQLQEQYADEGKDTETSPRQS